MAEERVQPAERQPRENKGFGPGARARGPRPKIEHPGRILKRIMGYTLKDYAVHWVVVILCIFASVFASLQGTLFMRTLIDSYIMPLLGDQNPDFGPLASAILRVAGFYGIGVVASFIQSRLMIYVTQGTMRNLRNDMFSRMEKLPIKYFDTHSHGDIMSMYTNDIDTMRQLISQSIPQLVNSVVSVVSVLISMFMLDVPLTLITLVMVSLMMVAAKKIGGLSSRFFLSQQRSLGALNGCVEETMTGQKVQPAE